MSHGEYEHLLRKVLEKGEKKSDRTETGTRSIFGAQLVYDLQEGFPLITSKKVFWKGVVAELLWFVSGSTKVEDLRELGTKIWDAWELEDGTIGPGYSEQWRSVKNYREGGEIDQLGEVIEQIKTNPHSRRHIVNAWNVQELPHMALPPCHVMFQFYVRKNKYLDLMLTQRSADAPVGLPFNIASYSLLLHMVAQQTDYLPGKFVWNGGDVHIYENQIEAVKEQLSRPVPKFPKLHIDGVPPSIDDYSAHDFVVYGYEPMPSIKMKVAV